MAGQFDLQPSFPIAGVADLIANRPYKEQQMRAQQQQQLVQGLDAFGQGVNSLVQKRNAMAQAMVLGKNLGMAPEETQGLTPEQVIQAATVKKGYVGADLISSLFKGLNPNGGPAGVAPTVASPAGLAPVASTGGPILASQTTAVPVDQPSAATPATPPSTGAVPVPIPAPPVKPRQFNPAELKLITHVTDTMRPENVYTNNNGVITPVGQVPKGSKFVSEHDPSAISDKDKQKEQDLYWRDAVSGLRGIRGDTAMKDIETQRNAAIVAYNRLKSLEVSGEGLNPIDYVDILGQIYKARTGTAPTQEVLKEAKQVTATGQFGKYWTYLTGEQMPATSQGIAGSLKNMVAHMGLQSDELHDGYMQVHGPEVFNPNMSPENVKKLSKLSRGKSFAEATGAKPEDFDPHIQAIKWAQANPNDPRSAAILKKAMDAKQSGGGGSIGL